MPHLVILYTPKLEGSSNLDALCRSLADAMLAVRDEDGKQVFPTGGTRVLAFPEAHHAWPTARRLRVMYLNLAWGGARAATESGCLSQVKDSAIQRPMDTQ